MTNIFLKIKDNLKKVVIFSSLFLAVFFGLFYLVNFDFKNSQEKYAQKQLSVAPISYSNDEFKKRLGSTTFSLGTYEDWVRRYDLYVNNQGYDSDPDKDNLPNYLEYIHGTNPLKADTDGDGYFDRQEITNGYDPDAPGDTRPAVEISVAKINIEAPMVWSKTEIENEMLKDLENGVAHYAKTTSPGQNGNTVISGHSSNYLWAKGNYNYIFKNLNDLEAGDEIIVKTFQKNGRVIIYHYKVSDVFTTGPDDEAIFAPSDSPVLTLSTCWPLGTNLKRLIVKADLIK